MTTGWLAPLERYIRCWSCTVAYATACVMRLCPSPARAFVSLAPAADLGTLSSGKALCTPKAALLLFLNREQQPALSESLSN